MIISDIDCVVPAAGLSSRTPGHKLLAPFGGQPLLHWAVENAAAACRRVIVVVGHNEPQIRKALPALERLLVITNEHYRLGMLTSIAAGAAAVETSRFFVAPADMPFLSPQIYRAVASAARVAGHAGTDATARYAGTDLPDAPSPGAAAWFPEFGGRRGHPVLVSAAIIPALARVVATAIANQSQPGSMRDLLTRYETVSVPVDDEGTLVDIDTVDDFARYHERAGGRS